MKSSSLPLPGTLWVGLLVGTGHGNNHAIETAIGTTVSMQGTDHITIPYLADEDLVKEAVQNCLTSKIKN